MAPKLKEPRIKPPWPPTGHAGQVAVNHNDNWWTLAADHGRADAWDLIVFNFNTYDPAEVNWYLHHWVNCRRSPDGKNYSFGAPTAGPQHIYLPPAGWTPPNSADAIAAFYVSRVLNTGTVRSLYASVAPLFLSIASHDFGRVSLLVNTGRIRVRFDPAHPHAAEYDPQADTMILSTIAGGGVNQSYVVHEAVHASFDHRRSNGVYTTYEQEEPFAYIVQMLYLVKLGHKTVPGAGTGFPAEPIWTAAWPVAQDIAAGNRVDPGDVEKVYQAWQRLNLHMRGPTLHNGVR